MILKDRNKYRRFKRKQLFRKFNKLFDLYAAQFVVTTIIPFRAGVVLQELINKKPLPKYKKYLSAVKKLRLVSAYVPFEKIVLGSLFKEIAKRSGFKDHTVLFNLTPQEIEKLVLGKFLASEWEIRKRNQRYIYFRIKNKDVFLWEKHDYKKYKEIFRFKVAEIDLKKGLTGSAVYPGKVRCRAKIVFTAKNIAKFKKGDILVSINASPRFITAIKKAAGIVADEGGVTCHAAIMASEMGKPCIIGTKIATKVLKNNQLVEVDADKGMVRLIR